MKHVESEHDEGVRIVGLNNVEARYVFAEQHQELVQYECEHGPFGGDS